MTTETSNSASIESVKDFDKTPEGQYKYWAEELSAARYANKSWHKKADKIVSRFLGESKQSSAHNAETFNLNLFHSNVTTLASMLYGNTPKIDVSRRYAQPADDVGRVAAEMMERLLNLDIAENGAEIDAVLRSTLQDRLLPGLGCARVRYDVETKEVEGVEQVVFEDAPVEYYYWGDVAWGWARNFAEVPWIGFRNYLTKDETEERFGKTAAEDIPLKKQKMQTSEDGDQNQENDSAWMKQEIWEIWDKKTRTVRWIAEGYDKQLDEKEDPLQLTGFFPTPPFLMANPTTSRYKPTPDFTLAQDLYNEVDKLQMRISIITEAVKVVGVYDASAAGVQKMFKTGLDNDLIPIENWALFAEKGGIAGQIDWVPLQDIVAALDKLVALRDQTIGLLQQVTGMSDIMRGELGSAYEGVGQSEMKAKFGSIRVQALQDQFARFASDLMQIKAEVISRHFMPETIVNRANMEFSMDAQLVPQAVALIKDPKQARLRVDIRPESVAMVDYAQIKTERTDFLNAIGTYMQSTAQLTEGDPSMKPLTMQLLQWGLAGFKGASEIEGVVDKAIQMAQQKAMQQQNQPQPDPAQQAAQAAQQLEQMKAQNAQQLVQTKGQMDMQVRQQDMQADMQTTMQEHQTKIAEREADLQGTLGEIRAKLEADVLLEQVQSSANIQQTQATGEMEMQKDAVEAQIDIAKEEHKTALKINEIAASASAKIKEAKAKPAPGGSSDE